MAAYQKEVVLRITIEGDKPADIDELEDDLEGLLYDGFHPDAFIADVEEVRSGYALEELDHYDEEEV